MDARFSVFIVCDQPNSGFLSLAYVLLRRACYTIVSQSAGLSHLQQWTVGCFATGIAGLEPSSLQESGSWHGFGDPTHRRRGWWTRDSHTIPVSPLILMRILSVNNLKPFRGCVPHFPEILLYSQVLPSGETQMEESVLGYLIVQFATLQGISFFWWCIDVAVFALVKFEPSSSWCIVPSGYGEAGSNYSPPYGSCYLTENPFWC